jgi:hypothetical protein
MSRGRRSPGISSPLSAVTFCIWHPHIAMVRRGPVRGPSHPCKRCNQRHRRHDSVVSVQLACTVHGAVVLIIRRSWVRAPPAPPPHHPREAPLTCGYAPVRGALVPLALCGCVRLGAARPVRVNSRVGCVHPGKQPRVHPPDHQTRPRVYQLQGIKPGTVRHAFLALADEGLVHIRHGRTTTIAGEPA